MSNAKWVGFGIGLMVWGLLGLLPGLHWKTPQQWNLPDLPFWLLFGGILGVAIGILSSRTTWLAGRGITSLAGVSLLGPVGLVSGFLVGAVSNDTEYYLMAAATIGCLGGIIGIIGGAILGAIYAPKTSDRLSEGGRRIIMGAIIGIGVGLLGGAIAQVIDHTLVYLISESVRSEQSWMEILLDDWSLLWISGIFPGAIAGTSVATVLGLSANHTKTGSTP